MSEEEDVMADEIIDEGISFSHRGKRYRFHFNICEWIGKSSRDVNFRKLRKNSWNKQTRVHL